MKNQRTIKNENANLQKKKHCLFLLLLSTIGNDFLFLSVHFQECEAASLYQAGGIAIDLRTDLPYGMEISHDDGGGPDGSFGGKLHVKLYGTVDTSHTQKLLLLLSIPMGCNMV